MDVIIYSSPDDKKKNRGFCFLEYETHKAASLAKRRLGSGRIKVWSCDVIVDWADPQEEPDKETMAKVRTAVVQECRMLKYRLHCPLFRDVFRHRNQVRGILMFCARYTTQNEKLP